jgi:hypothetical protein
MLQGLRSLSASVRYLLRIHRELTLLRKAQERCAAAMEFANQQQYPMPAAPHPDDPSVTVEYVNEQYQSELMDAELRLTRATGQPPTEEEILRAYAIDHPDQRPAERLDA